jgi:hypothetical protein
MPRAHQVLAGSSFDPAALKNLCELFDKVWASLAPEFADSPETVADARTRLAMLMVKLSADRQLSDAQITATATRLLRAIPLLN